MTFPVLSINPHFLLTLMGYSFSGLSFNTVGSLEQERKSKKINGMKIYLVFILNYIIIISETSRGSIKKKYFYSLTTLDFSSLRDDLDNFSLKSKTILKTEGTRKRVKIVETTSPPTTTLPRPL